MEKEQKVVLPPPPDEIVRTAMSAHIARWQLAYEQRRIQEEIRKKADEKIIEFNKIIEACRAACRGFGYDRENEVVWAEALHQFRNEAREMFNRSRPPEVAEWVDAPKQTTPKIEAKPSRPPIRDIVLDRLRASKEGMKANEIRAFILDTYAAQDIHEKTVGMTLYRLSKESPPLVRRKGRIWLFEPPKTELKNPDVVTPGSKNQESK